MSYLYDGVIAQEPEESKVRVLQRFLLAFTITRPATMLVIERAQRFSVGFNIDNDDTLIVTGLVYQYLQASRDLARRKRSRIIASRVAEADDNKPKYLVFTIRA